jgi:hypothetical protein
MGKDRNQVLARLPVALERNLGTRGPGGKRAIDQNTGGPDGEVLDGGQIRGRLMRGRGLGGGRFSRRSMPRHLRDHFFDFVLAGVDFGHRSDIPD